MSVLSYVVIADPDDAEDVCQNFLSRKFVWVDLPGFQLDCAISLLSALAKKRNNKKLAKDFPLLFSKDPRNGTCVYKISDELVELLSSLDARSVPEIAELWLEADDFMQVWQIDVESIEERLNPTARLEQKSTQEKRNRYCYGNRHKF